ncbi:insulin-like growth factor-binding protein complex acid labile subunit [Octopus bimaculoides]|uniref:insulin-like growth factor-binding protein complex acid labile subunit n=1 Tax=Octopus bimaculoides TaxID=37653 RepID=UPI00071DAB50|nr:insulin-like growth factor-binding protein complex acid labile subunit [Octopus bimaculoides]|eukprot:XP_014782534.1 PREDICTED: insulin-like growth factor-binding protein complex acid labile subunit [Octopus bimaculoides]
MFRQNFHVMLTFVLLLYLRLFLEAHAVSDVCNLCRCNDDTTRITCRYLNLTSVPQNIPHDVKYLDLSYNKISNIGKESFKNLSSLEELVLSRNEISEIEHGCFDDLPKLRILDLSHNQISNTEQGYFGKLTSLQTLNLRYNVISQIKQRSFENLPSLRSISLQSNNISKIEQASFEDLPSLRSIIFSVNRIQKYEDGAFLFLPSIKKILLYGPYTSSIGVAVLQCLDSRGIEAPILTFTKSSTADMTLSLV